MRTAYRNNRNTYTINGITSNYNEINNVLRQQGIDLDHKRFLILQGEVEAIALMKPKAANEHEEGLLEYLEDIIGTNKYVEPINQAMKELDQINEKHAEKALRVRAAEKECTSLVSEKEEAENFLRQENMLTEKRSQLLQVELWQAKKDLLIIEKRLTDSKAKLDAEREKNGIDAVTLDEAESAHKKINKEVSVSKTKIYYIRKILTCHFIGIGKENCKATNRPRRH